MKRIVGIIIGFILMIIGCFYLILYFNLFTFGFSIKEYFMYILTRYECYSFIIGLIIYLYFKDRKGITK